MKFIVKQEELNRLCEGWQDRLKLNDWKIATGITRQKSINVPERCGENDICLPRAESLIRLIAPDDYPDSPFEYDMEQVLVHELLHLKVVFFEPVNGSLAHEMWERVINNMATILVATKRKDVAGVKIKD